VEWWWRVAKILATQLPGVSRALQGAPNPGFVGRKGGGDVGDNQNGYPL